MHIIWTSEQVVLESPRIARLFLGSHIYTIKTPVKYGCVGLWFHSKEKEEQTEKICEEERSSLCLVLKLTTTANIGCIIRMRQKNNETNKRPERTNCFFLMSLCVRRVIRV